MAYATLLHGILGLILVIMKNCPLQNSHLLHKHVVTRFIPSSFTFNHWTPIGIDNIFLIFSAYYSADDTLKLHYVQNSTI